MSSKGCYRILRSSCLRMHSTPQFLPAANWRRQLESNLLRHTSLELSVHGPKLSKWHTGYTPSWHSNVSHQQKCVSQLYSPLNWFDIISRVLNKSLSYWMARSKYSAIRGIRLLFISLTFTWGVIMGLCCILAESIWVGHKVLFVLISHCLIKGAKWLHNK